MGFNNGNNYYFDVDLSNEKDIPDFTAFPRAVERGFEKGLIELGDRMKLKLIENLLELGLGNSSFMDNIEVDISEYGIRMQVDSDHACYVEFGTGIVGADSPHPKPWAYDINGHGEDGWQYLGDDGRLHWTMGSESRPFMYNTWLWATRSATQIVRKNIRAELRKIKGVK